MSVLKSVQASDLGLGAGEPWGQGTPRPWEEVSSELDGFWLTGKKKSGLSRYAGLRQEFASEEREGWWPCVKGAV